MVATAHDGVAVHDEAVSTSIHEFYTKNPVLHKIVLVLTVVAPLLGFVLTGWRGVVVGMIVSVVLYFLGGLAVMKVREITHG